MIKSVLEIKCYDYEKKWFGIKGNAGWGIWRVGVEVAIITVGPKVNTEEN